MYVIIDRFESDYVVVETENGKMLNLPKELFPSADEGDVIRIAIDYDETSKRHKNIKNLMGKLKREDKINEKY